MNIAIIEGEVNNVRERELPGGGSAVTFYVTTVDSALIAAESVPVVWYDPSPGLAAGDEVRVEGKVTTRYYRVAGATQSRCEVTAAKVVRL